MVTNLPAARRAEALDPFLERLRTVPFVRDARLLPAKPRREPPRFDARIRVSTAAGSFDFDAEVQRSYLDTASIDAVIWTAERSSMANHRLILLARYIPRPSAERLIEKGIDFVDLAGNVHLDLQPKFHWTVIGHREPANGGRISARTPASLQVLFTIAARPESGEWTVRDLSAAAGVSKSKAADARRSLTRDGTFRQLGGRFRPVDPRELREQLVTGYRQILRPRLTMGRFRPPERDIEGFLARLRKTAETEQFRYALSGAPAAHLLQRFYRGPHVPIFVERPSEHSAKQLRLLPDREGPITLLELFGESVPWRILDGLCLAHPWLIYAELRYEADPRAQEAAEELRREYLTP